MPQPAAKPSSPSSGKKLVLCLRTGRFGNRVMLFAHLVAMAEEQGHELINFAFHSYAHLFESTRQDIYCRYPATEKKSWMDTVPGVSPALRKTRLCLRLAYCASILNEYLPFCGKKVVTLRQRRQPEADNLDGATIKDEIRDARLVFLLGFRFRSPSVVMQRHAEKIRAYFRPIAEIERAGRESVDRLRKNADVVVGVHIRRGDYETWKSGQFFFPVPRYAAWMREFAGQFSGRKVAFFVCSNEPRSENEFQGLSVGLGAGSVMNDLEGLSQCDYIFGPRSSFSQWASFYGNKPLYLLHSADDMLEVQKFAVSWLEVTP